VSRWPLACAYAARPILAVSQDSRLDPAIGGCLRNHGETPSSTGLVQERGVDAAVPELTARGAVNSHGPKRPDHDRGSTAHGGRPDQPISGAARAALRPLVQLYIKYV
jgi:hypothetical protein